MPTTSGPLVYSDPEILGGAPVFIGTRVQVASLFEWLAEGESLNQWLDNFPGVRREQALAVLAEAKTSAMADARSMRTSDPRAGERVRDVKVTEDDISVDLMDGRTIIVPLVWYPRLLHATPAQRARWEIAGGGFGIHWPEIDEDLSTAGMLRGAPAPGTLTTA
jgi:uncharacterized protein (DUF433 family)